MPGAAGRVGLTDTARPAPAPGAGATAIRALPEGLPPSGWARSPRFPQLQGAGLAEFWLGYDTKP
jgi:hypothetical protein